MKKTYTLHPEEPGDFDTLTRAAMNVCSYFSLVVQDQQSSRRALECLRLLQEHFLQREERSAWPGTVIWGRTASVFTYRLNSGSLATLLELGSSFSTWLEPDRPEDLSFLRADFTVWLGSVAHEHDVFLELEEHELIELLQIAPQMAERLIPSGSVEPGDRRR